MCRADPGLAPLVGPLLRSPIRHTTPPVLPTPVEKRDRDTANGVVQTDPLKKPLAGCVSLGLSVFSR